ncbi:hypothetical protein BDY24DRAFT_406962 [Mrakia frigida]|uniref:uncharacterized protein n=1 Tax=Mrakia frigida TaxID=29902 RepID=UPI003FCC0B4B
MDVDKNGSGSKEEIEHRDIPTAPSIESNDEALATVKNPLHGISKEQMFRDVDLFAQEFGLSEHIDVLRKGALLAQNPHDYEFMPELTDEDKATITHEHTHKWSQPAMLYVTIALCSLGAAVHGWDQTGSNGANLSFPSEFGIGRSAPTPGYQTDEWIVGLVNASPYIASAVLGCWLSDPVNNLIGRRGAIFLTAIILVITPICSGLTQTWVQLFVVRFLLGIGMGIKGATVPIFAAENSPAPIRGALGAYFGIFLGFAANVVVMDVGALAWRLQLGSAFIPALPLAIGIYFCPESPRWLMKKNRYPKAWKSLCRLRFTELQAARDIYYIHVQLMEERKIIRGDNYFRRAMELFTIPRVRRATVASGVVMLAQQMCGINIIAFYSSTIFVLGGSTQKQALFASLGFGAVNFVFAFPAIFTIDRYGRRALLLFTFPGMALSILGAGLAFLIPNESADVAGSMKIGVIAFFIFLFAAIYSPGEGPVPFTYSAEVFPLAQREQGMAWAVSTCLGWASVLSITFPRMLAALSPTGAFGFYAGLNVMALFLIYFFVPETKQFSLEELDMVFEIKTRDHIRYNNNVAVPYWCKKYLLRNKNVRLEPLIAGQDNYSAKVIGHSHAQRTHPGGSAEKGEGVGPSAI